MKSKKSDGKGQDVPTPNHTKKEPKDLFRSLIRKSTAYAIKQLPKQVDK